MIGVVSQRGVGMGALLMKGAASCVVTSTERVEVGLSTMPMMRSKGKKEDMMSRVAF